MDVWIYECNYIFINVCMYGWMMYVWIVGWMMYVWIVGWIYGWMGEWVGWCTDGWAGRQVN